MIDIKTLTRACFSKSRSVRPPLGSALSQLAALAGLVAIQAMLASPAVANTPKVMVVGDSISAGFLRPSYRQALTQGLANASCPVDMVGDQTLTSFSFNDPVNLPGQHFPDFSPANGDDTDHQAFGGIRADQIVTGFTSGAGVTIQPIANYAAAEQPDYVLLHAGTNDLAAAVTSISASGIPAWATTTVNDMDNIIDDILGVVPGATIIVGNHIPRKGETTAALMALEDQMNTAYRDELTARIASRADSRVLLADVATGFNSTSMTTDGIHPNAVGEEHIAGAFEAVLLGAGLCQVGTPVVVSPTANSVIAGNSVTLTWADNGTNADEWWVYVGDTQSGQDDDYFNSGRITNSSARNVQINNLPEDGSTVTVALWFKANGSWDFILTNYTSEDAGGTGGNVSTPTINSPTAGSTINGTSATLSWSANGTNANTWRVKVGSTPGSNNLFASGNLAGSARSVTMTNLPNDGSIVYVSLRYRVGTNAFVDINTTYVSGTTSNGGNGTPAITSPADGSTINGNAFTLNWNANGANITDWWVFVGASATEFQSDDYFNSQLIANDNANSVVVTGMPEDGSTVYVRLWFKSGGTWDYVTVPYISADNAGGIISAPTITAPATGSTISGTSATLSWNNNGTNVNTWRVKVGTSLGGNNIFSSGNLSKSTSSVVMTNLPNDGSTIYVALRYRVGTNAFVDINTTYTSGSGGSGGSGNIPSVVSPANNTTIAGSSFTLNWNANGANITDWWVFVGASATAFQSDDYFNSQLIANDNATSVVVTGMPEDGSTVYARLWFKSGGTWDYVTMTYISADNPGGGISAPTISSPSNGSTINGTSATLSWNDNGTNVNTWRVKVGTTAGGNNIFTSGNLSKSTSSVVMTNLPNDGSTIYVTLRYRVGTNAFVDVTTTHISGTSSGGSGVTPEVVTPTSNATIAGSSFTLNWDDNGANITDWWVFVGASPTDAQSDDYFNSQLIANDNASSVVVTGMPEDGSKVYARLWFKSGGTWDHVTVTYTSAAIVLDPPTITSPAAGTNIFGNSATLTWDANDTSPNTWRVKVGSTPGGNNIFTSGNLSSSTSSVVMMNLPDDGSTIYVSLRYRVGSNSFIDVTRTFISGVPSGAGDPPPLDLSTVNWLHADVSDWSITANLSNVSITSSQLCMSYDQANNWPAVNVFNADLVANAWVFIWNDATSQWDGATWEWLRPGQTCKSPDDVDGAHIKRAPYGANSGWEPSSGDTLYFMVSGLARTNDRNVMERSQPVKVIWP